MEGSRPLFLNSDYILAALTGERSRSTAVPVFDRAFRPLREIESECRTASRILLFLDFDGTLVPLAPRPEEARPTAAVLRLLSRLVRTAAIEVVVISGRPLAQLRSLLPVQGLTYIGTHGAEVRPATGETQWLIHPNIHSTALAPLRCAVEARIRNLAGVQLEDKCYALALHYRLARAATATRAISQFLATVTEYQRKGLMVDTIHGKKVIEVRPAGMHKGNAVQALLQGRSNTTLPIYIGDDTTDEDAFRVLTGRGLTILVADEPRPTAAQYSLNDQTAVTHFLSWLLRLRHNVWPIQ